MDNSRVISRKRKRRIVSLNASSGAPVSIHHTKQHKILTGGFAALRMGIILKKWR
jgi:hypothetical protein